MTGSSSPEVSTCQTVTSPRPRKESEFVEVCQKPTHPPLLFQFHFFFFHDLYFQDLSCEKKQEKKQEVKRSSAVTGYVAQPSVEQHLTLCSYFASFKPFHAVSLSLGLHQTLCEFNVLTL